MDDYCPAVQPHWGWPCSRLVHPPGTPHFHEHGIEIIALWWR